MKWNKSASQMHHAMHVAILNFKREKNSPRPEHAKDFRESLVLQFRGTQMMQHQHGDRRGKSAVSERQRGGVSSYNIDTSSKAVRTMSRL